MHNNQKDVTMKNEKKVNVSIILSVIAIILVLGIIAIWCIRVKDFSVVTENTFIGACISLISLALPIIIGYQVITSLDIKHSLKESEDKLERLKTKFEEEFNLIQEKNKELFNSLEQEIKERELFFQYIKVAMYHGKTIQNSALALYEQLNVIKLVIELNKTKELKENVELLFRIIQEIHQTDFDLIQSDNNNKIVGLNNKNYFKFDQYEKYIKKELWNLPQINEMFAEALIWVEKSFDCKMHFLKNGTTGNVDAINEKIEIYLNQISKDL